MKCGIVVWAGAALLGLAPLLPANAQEPGDRPRSRHVRPRVTEMTVTGKVAKTSWKDKEGNTRVGFSVTTQGGDKITLATGIRAEDGQPTTSQLEKFADKVITVAGKGYTTEEGGQPVVHIVSVTRILVVDPDAGK